MAHATVRRALFGIFLCACSASTVFAGNAGFAPNVLWYSKTPVLADTPVHIFTVVYNGTDTPITGDVVFYDNEVPIANATVSLASGASRIIRVPWTPESGERNVRAVFENTIAQHADGSTTTPELARVETGTDTLFVDIDTDGDGIGNRDDTDDDNDGLTDDEEAELGSDPLVADTDGDGITDGDDQNPLVADAKSEDTNASTTHKISTTSSAVAQKTKDIIADAFALSEKARETLNSYARTNIAKLHETDAAPEAQVEIGVDDNNGLLATPASSTPSADTSYGGVLNATALYANHALAFLTKNHFLFYATIVFALFLIIRFLYKRNQGDRFDA